MRSLNAKSEAMAWIKLVRLPNLLIVALTQYLLFYRIITPSLGEAGIEPYFDALHFFLLVLDTVIITACGYLANDLGDQAIDLQNRPASLIVGRKLSAARVKKLLSFLVLAGFSLAFYLALFSGRFFLLALYPLALGGLMAYNLWLKRLPLLGNLVVALYCAGVAGILALAESGALKQLHLQEPGVYRAAIGLMAWYMAFALLSTLCREIVKDMEDMKGDRSAGYRTIPLAWGEAAARILALAAGVVLAVFLVLHAFFFREAFSVFSLVYIGLAIFLPTLVILWHLGTARNKEAYHRISQLIKGVMVTGLILLFFI